VRKNPTFPKKESTESLPKKKKKEDETIDIKNGGKKSVSSRTGRITQSNQFLHGAGTRPDSKTISSKRGASNGLVTGGKNELGAPTEARIRNHQQKRGSPKDIPPMAVQS